MEPDRRSMVCCPFHSDNAPSMKLNDTYYYCFGCGATGDVIDLTAKLFRPESPASRRKARTAILGLTRTSHPLMLSPCCRPSAA